MLICGGGGWGDTKFLDIIKCNMGREIFCKNDIFLYLYLQKVKKYQYSILTPRILYRKNNQGNSKYGNLRTSIKINLCLKSLHKRNLKMKNFLLFLKLLQIKLLPD